MLGSALKPGRTGLRISTLSNVHSDISCWSLLSVYVAFVDRSPVVPDSGSEVTPSAVQNVGEREDLSVPGLTGNMTWLIFSATIAGTLSSDASVSEKSPNSVALPVQEAARLRVAEVPVRETISAAVMGSTLP